MLPLSLDFKDDAPVLDAQQPALEPPPPIARQLQLHARLAPREALVAGDTLERPVEPRGGNFQPFVIDAFDRQGAREMVAHAGAILDRDPPRGIDEDPEQSRA